MRTVFAEVGPGCQLGGKKLNKSGTLWLGVWLSWQSACLACRKPWFILQHSINWTLWSVLIISEFRRFGQEEQEFKVVFGYIRNFKVAQGL